MISCEEEPGIRKPWTPLWMNGVVWIRHLWLEEERNSSTLISGAMCQPRPDRNNEYSTSQPWSRVSSILALGRLIPPSDPATAHFLAINSMPTDIGSASQPWLGQLTTITMENNQNKHQLAIGVSLAGRLRWEEDEMVTIRDARINTSCWQSLVIVGEFCVKVAATGWSRSSDAS